MHPHLVFTAGSSPSDLLIRAGTLSKASHVAIGLDDQLLHAYEPGVMFEPRSAWLDQHNKLVAEFAVLPDVDDGLTDTFSRIGERYDMFGTVHIALHRAFRFASPLLFPRRRARGAHTCASLVMLLDPFGDRIPEWRGIDFSIAVPQDLLEATNLGMSFERIR